MTSPRVIEFFFDIGSPYSYLAATQVGRLEDDTGVQVRWRPFLLGGVFKATGSNGPGAAAKMRWQLRDLVRWAEDYGVPFKMNPRFPFNTLLAQRALTAAGLQGGQGAVQALGAGLFASAWAAGGDVATPEGIAAIATKAGLEPAPLLEAATQQATKDALRETTDEAVRRGAFGAPALFWGEALFWGNDRLDQLARRVKRELSD